MNGGDTEPRLAPNNFCETKSTDAKSAATIREFVRKVSSPPSHFMYYGEQFKTPGWTEADQMGSWPTLASDNDWNLFTLGAPPPLEGTRWERLT